MSDLQKKANKARELVDELNSVLKDLEGQGCDIVVHSSLTRVEYINIEKVTKL